MHLTFLMKIIDERQRCDTRCDVMKWSNSEVQSRQWKMPIISVEDNENNIWKRNAKKKQRQQRTRKTKAKVKGWELNDFVVHLS